MNVKKYLMIVCCVVGVCLAVLSGVIAATKYISALPGMDENEIIDLPEAKSRANILLMGVDKAEARTDTIMLVSLDSVNKKISILSIPRDTRVVYDGKYDKITHLYGYEGKEKNTIKAVTQITGLPIHYYATVNFKCFRSVIDMLGGVDFDVPNVNNTGGMFYNDPAQNLKINLKAGMQRLNGEQAEGLVRFRSGYPEADLGRIKMQQNFVKEVVKQKLQLKYIGKAPEIYKEVISNTKTNYSLKDMTAHLKVLSKVDKETGISTFSLPGYGTEAYTRYGYASCFIYNVSETDTLIKANFKSAESEEIKR